MAWKGHTFLVFICKFCKLLWFPWICLKVSIITESPFSLKTTALSGEFYFVSHVVKIDIGVQMYLYTPLFLSIYLYKCVSLCVCVGEFILKTKFSYMHIYIYICMYRYSRLDKEMHTQSIWFQIQWIILLAKPPIIWIN